MRSLLTCGAKMFLSEKGSRRPRRGSETGRGLGAGMKAHSTAGSQRGGGNDMKGR